MTITLNSDQRAAIKAHVDGPAYVVDSDAERTYVLISAEDWQRVRPLLGDDEFDAADAAAAHPPLQAAPAGTIRPWKSMTGTTRIGLSHDDQPR
jgi:hypothetical protein